MVRHHNLFTYRFQSGHEGYTILTSPRLSPFLYCLPVWSSGTDQRNLNLMLNGEYFCVYIVVCISKQFSLSLFISFILPASIFLLQSHFTLFRFPSLYVYFFIVLSKASTDIHFHFCSFFYLECIKVRFAGFNMYRKFF